MQIQFSFFQLWDLIPTDQDQGKRKVLVFVNIALSLQKSLQLASSHNWCWFYPWAKRAPSCRPGRGRETLSGAGPGSPDFVLQPEGILPFTLRRLPGRCHRAVPGTAETCRSLFPVLSKPINIPQPQASATSTGPSVSRWALSWVPSGRGQQVCGLGAGVGTVGMGGGGGWGSWAGTVGLAAPSLDRVSSPVVQGCR